jgi:hypothetical protein
LNHFPYPVSLVWRGETLDDGVQTILADELPNEWHIATQNGHIFEVVKRGTDKVVDYFRIATPEGGMEVVVDVGPHERSPPFRAKVLNGFPFPVSLYWVRDQDKVDTRVLMEELLQGVYHFDTSLGHRFAIVKLETGEVVDSFEIEGGDPGRHFVVSVGPSGSKIPNNGNADEL